MIQVAQEETEVQQATDALETDITSLEESPDGETHEVVGVDGGEHTTGVFPPFDATTFPSQLLWLAITFAALYLIMSRMALPRVAEIIEVRRDRIEGDLAEADRLRQKTDQAVETYENELSQARAKAHDIAEQKRNEIKADIEAKRAKVEADLAKKVSTAEARITETKSEALGHVDEIAAETAQSVVARLLAEPQIDTARQAVSKVAKG